MGVKSRTQQLTLLGVFLGLASSGFAAEAVSNLLSVHRIVTQADGHEASDPAATGKPGDVLEYVATFHNNGASTARGLSATLPLPVGTEFIPGSEHPAAARASIDGITFGTLPLKRLVKAPDGSFHEELIPSREYRYLRWTPTDLAPNGDLAVSARVLIAANTRGP